MRPVPWRVAAVQRIYEGLIREHLGQERQMVFLTGPRQVGKTTTARTSAGEQGHYLNWDRQEDRVLITRGADAVAQQAGFATLAAKPPVLVLDEIHKYPKWKSFLKGLFDTHGGNGRIIATGSSRLNIFKRGGDSLMGRYFPYRMHPLSVREILQPAVSLDKDIQPPLPCTGDPVQSLLSYGGFPEPFLKQSARFYNRWSSLRTEQLFREDLRDLTRIQEAGQIHVLSELLVRQTGQLVNYSNLAVRVNASVDTMRRWLGVLESFYFCFTIRPWFRNVAKSLRKQPKVYLWDWSALKDPGARHENFVASHLLKEIHWWTDAGLGRYDLHYLRDKEGREVDFLVSRDGRPWFLVEVKSSSGVRISPQLEYYQKSTGAAHAFQASFDLDYVERDCFSVATPVSVPVSTLLAQLI